jgi:hypothetical protein
VPEFEVEVEVEHLTELCSMYWATNDDGSFTHTVKAIAERFGQPSYKVSKIVSEACFARSLSHRCTDCNKGFMYRTRSDLTSSTRFTPARCRACVEAEKRRQEEQREQAKAAKRATILNSFTVRDDELTPHAEELDLPAALALAALIEDAEEVSDGITTPTGDRTDCLTPTPDYDFELLGLLVRQGFVRLHPSSSLNAFVWKEDGTLDNSHYPRLASYYLSGTGPLGGRVEEYRKSFMQIISREAWPDHWVDQFSEFWFDVVASECKAYLVHLLHLHGLDFTPGQKTDDVLRRGLKWYSIGQMYYFIW